ncbi:hypothetical protein H0H92_001955 [Tricholoma furcatifolium]|nr:hypothetical protein H0H92_001955 [Tricholoma furcatifolium]
MDHTPFEDQCVAANTLSPILVQLGYNHCYLGGFALAILGSTRPTHDIDVLVDPITPDQLKAMREKVVQVNPEFESTLLSFSFLKNGNDPKRRVPIETLRANNMGLPKVAGPSITVRNLPILRPDILFLTKVKRWDNNLDEIKRAQREGYDPRPDTVKKFDSDTSDLVWLLKYLMENKATIVIDDHQGKTRADFIKYMANFVIFETEQKNLELVDCLWAVLTERDRKEVQARL